MDGEPSHSQRRTFFVVDGRSGASVASAWMRRGDCGTPRGLCNGARATAYWIGIVG